VRPEAASNVSREPDAARLGAGSSTMGQGGIEGGVGMVAAGDYRFGADTGRLLIRTYRTGLGSRAGHDLTIEVTMWHGTAAVGADASASSVALRIDADSFEIRQGRGGIKPFTDADRADIRKTIQGLLDTARYPSITFESAGLRGVQPDLSVEGELTIRTATHPVRVRGSIDESSGKPQLRATAQVVQSEWGIKPYSAFFGALKLRDTVDIDVDATLVPID
jgi:polyisoprenoid-binding protein YceI